MTEQKMLGYVNWPPNHQACYVRINIPDWKTGIPLSIKATFSDFHWRSFEKDDIVTVERTDRKDARRFKVVHLLKPVQPVVKPVKPISKRKDETMAMGKDRVRFYIRDTYFSAHHKRIKMVGVMTRAFGLSSADAHDLLQGDGVWVTCRPSQFARFMIYRNDANIVNGFMDLRAELVTPEFKDFYTRLNAITGVDREAIKEIILALNFSVPDWEKQISRAEGQQPCQEVDVSGNIA